MTCIENLYTWGHPFMTSTRRGKGSGQCGRMWTGEGVRRMQRSTQRIQKFTRFIFENRIFFMKSLKIGHQKFWQIKYRNFAGQKPKIREISEKRDHFFGRHVDVHKRGGVRLMWTHVDRGRSGVKNPIFVWTSTS